MSSLEFNIQKLREGPMKKTFEALEKSFEEFSIDYYLIGAFARDMWLNHIDILPDRRTTRDIDFSLFINHYNDFKLLKQHLHDFYGFQLEDEPYRITSPDQIIVDLLPYGGIEEERLVNLEGKYPIKFSVFGNLEVLNHAKVINSGDSKFKICTLPGLCILKLISGHEKPDRYQKDINDFYYILVNYFDIANDTLFDEYHEDLINDDFEPKIAAARMLGRQILKILSESESLNNRIIALLTKLRGSFTYEEIHDMYKQNQNDQLLEKMKLVSEVLREIQE